MPVKRLSLLFAVLLPAIAAGLLLTSCGALQSNRQSLDEGFAGDADYYDSATPEAANRSGSDFEKGISASETRYVIKNGSMDLTVLNTRETVKQIINVVASAGGTISDTYIYEFKEGQYAADLTLRVPADRFTAIMDQLQELGKAANIRSGEGEVTMQYLDMEARIKNLKAQEERLREILDMASTVEDILNVERELSRVRGEIEVMTAQFTYLQDQVTFSTITLYLREEVIATQTISPAPFENLGSKIKEAFVRSINFISKAVAALIVVVAALVPVLIILALLAGLIWLLVTRLGRRKTPSA